MATPEGYAHIHDVPYHERHAFRQTERHHHQYRQWLRRVASRSIRLATHPRSMSRVKRQRKEEKK